MKKTACCTKLPSFFMKVALLQTFLTLAFVAVSFAKDAEGQGVLDQKISVSIKNENFKSALRKISQQAGIRFSYQRNTIPEKEKVSISANDETLNEVFKLLFQPYGIKYEAVGKQVILSKRKIFSLIKQVEEKNSNELDFFRPIKGTIKNSEGNPVPTASVLVKGTSKGTTTDEKGDFQIDANEGDILVVSAVGFETMELTIGSDTNISLVLKQSEKKLDEVIVVGYATQRKVTVTGAVTQVKGTELAKSPTVNLSNALVGRLPGVTAIQATGEPGYDGSTIRIRGSNTPNNSGALIVIDGVPDRAGGLDRLNPADIESMSVLKDAAAAIYGARAANGVILITTKRGKTGKPQVSYDFNQGWAQPTRIPEMSDAVEYATIVNELKLFSDVPSDQWTAAWTALKQNGTYTRTDNSAVVTAPFSPAVIQKHADGSDPWGYPNTDWFGTALKNWSPQQKHTLQLSGGSDAVKYLASIGYDNQDGIYKNSATGYKQYDARFNLDAKVNKYINVSLGLSAREEFRFFPTVGAQPIFRMLMRGKPTEQEVWPNGLPGPDIENGQNPIVITTNATGYDKDRRDYFQSNGRIELLIPGVEGLKLTGFASIDKYTRRTKRWETPWSLYFWDDRTAFEPDGTPKLVKKTRSTFTDPRLTESHENQLNINLSGFVNYDRTMGPHTVNLLAAVTRETINNENFNAFRRNFISPAIDQLFAGGDAQQNIGGGAFERARLSYFGRVNYNYKEKYLAEFLWRYDGSYIFPESDRFGFFPGFLVGWRISEEDFLKSVSFIDNLKLRASYGQMGNDNIVFNGALQEYRFLSTYGFNTYVIGNNVVKTLTETGVPNPGYTWEVANNANVGLEGSLLHGKLSFEFDYFVNVRNKILMTSESITPASAGFNSPPENLGKVKNRGWEFIVSYNNSIGDLRYNVSVNGGYSKNEIIKLPETPGLQPWQLSKGHTFGTNGPAFLVYEYDGVFATQADIDKNTIDYSAAVGTLNPGDMKFKDINGDNKIDELDRTRLDKNRDPLFTGGLSINLQYKNFDCSILFQGATGGLLFFGTESGTIGNFLKYSYDNRWSVENPSNVDPRLTERGNRYYASGAYGFNTYWLRNSDYLRLKNIEIGYNVSPEILKRAGMTNLRLYVNGLNLVTWDKMKIWDPESTSGSGQYYPQSRILNVGARVTF